MNQVKKCTCSAFNSPEEYMRSEHHWRHFVPTGWALQYETLNNVNETRTLVLLGKCDRCNGAMKEETHVCWLNGSELLAELYRLMERSGSYGNGRSKTGAYSSGGNVFLARWYQAQDDLPVEEKNHQFLELFHDCDKPVVSQWIAENKSKEPYTAPRRDRKSTLLNAILQRARADGSMDTIDPILDYILPNDGEPLFTEEDTYLTNYEFDIVPRIAFGGSEGIYLDLYLEGSFDSSGKERARIGTFKTLGTDLKTCRLMGELAGILMYHGSAYVNQNIHRYQGVQYHQF